MIKQTVVLACVLLGGATALPVTQARAEATYDIKEMTPEIKAALDSRRERFNQLADLKRKGSVGENKSGYVEVLKDRAEAGALVEAENTNRRLIYKAIVEQNDLSASALATIEEVFAEVQRNKASAGDKIQTKDGKWTVK